MANTANKNYNNQSTGTNAGTWGIVLNSNFTAIDNNLGGTLTLSVAGSANITLTSAQAQNLIYNLTGVLTGSINVIFPAAGGLYLISNQTTGAFALTIQAGASSSGVTVPQNGVSLVFVDNSTGPPTVSSLVSFGAVTASSITNSGSITNAGSSTSTGYDTAAAFIPTGSAPPPNGLYLPASNAPALAANSSAVMQFDPTNGIMQMFRGLYANQAALGTPPSSLVMDYASGGRFSADTNGITYYTGGVGTTPQFKIIHTSSSTNTPTVTGSAGGNPTISTTGGNLNLASAGGSVLAPTPSANDSTTKVATTAFANPSSFLGNPGFVEFPSGILEQWGTFTTSASGYTNLNFPKNFSTAVYAFNGTVDTNGLTNATVSANLAAATTGSIPLAASNPSAGFVAVTMSYRVIGK